MKSHLPLASVFLTVTTGVRGRHCSSRLAAVRTLIPPQVPVSQSKLLRTTQCESVIGTPPENDDPGFPPDSSDAILLKELKSIIQEHSTHGTFSRPRILYMTIPKDFTPQTITTAMLTPLVGSENELLGIIMAILTTMITTPTTRTHAAERPPGHPSPALL